MSWSVDVNIKVHAVSRIMRGRELYHEYQRECLELIGTKFQSIIIAIYEIRTDHNGISTASLLDIFTGQN